MKFWKMHGAGNDFVLIPDLERALPDETLPELARRVCRRRLSLGADGMMVVRPAEGEGDFKMLFFNSDGSVGEMCGNGARCVSRFGWETGLGGETVRVETTAGLVTGYREAGGLWRVRLNDPGNARLDMAVTAGGREYRCAYVELGCPGIPHAAVALPEDADTGALRALGRELRFHAAFPRGANVNFYEIKARDRIRLKTYERGVEDFTYACGTGTGATVWALHALGLTESSVTAEMEGGTLRVDLEYEGDRLKNLWLTGPAAVTAKGELTDEA